MLVLLLCGLVPAAGTGISAAQADLPRFEQTACAFPLGQGIGDGTDVRCGYLVVPEDRAQPSGRTVRLAVADFKSGTGDADPLVYLQGGPGIGIVSMLGPAITKNVVGRIAGGHDLILLDQRGTGLSKPSLACTEIATVRRQIMARHLSRARLSALLLRAAGQCHDRLVRAGINLSAYTTEADAADVAALGPALGYSQVNVYGVSYGTRVALTVMRLFPTGIRSVILDSVLPPQVDLFTQFPASMAHAFDTLYRGCAADTACNAAYPHLETALLTVIDYLNAHPATLHVPRGDGVTRTALLTGDELARIMFVALYTRGAIEVVPSMIDAAIHHRYALFAEAEAASAAGNVISDGDTFSVECSEDAPFVSASAIITATQALHTQLQPASLDDEHFGLTGYKVCQRWGVIPADQTQKMPVTSAIPTLILAGQYDPITPPDLGQMAAQTLSHSYAYTFPGVGHALFLFDLCATSVALSFLNNPTQPPNASCISTMTAPAFYTLP